MFSNLVPCRWPPALLLLAFVVSHPRSHSHHIFLFLLVTAASSVEGGSCSHSAKLLASWSQVHKSSIGCRSLSLNTWSRCRAHVIVLLGRKVPAAGSWLKSRCQFLAGGGGDVWMEGGCDLCPLSCSSLDHTAKQHSVLLWLDVDDRTEGVRRSYICNLFF